MLVQPSRTATVCEVDRARKRAASCNRVQNLGYRINKYWRSVRSETTLLTPNSSCEACSAFTRVAACTLARSPYFVTRYPKASDISSPPCLLRLLPAGAVAGWDLHPLESAAFSRRTPEAEISDLTQTRCAPQREHSKEKRQQRKEQNAIALRCTAYAESRCISPP